MDFLLRTILMLTCVQLFLISTCYSQDSKTDMEIQTHETSDVAIQQRDSKVIGSLNISEGWTIYSIDLKKQLKKWGESGDYLRIDLGKIPDKTMKIRGLRFRIPIKREQEIAANNERRKKNEAQLKKDLERYFQKSYADTIEIVRVTNDKIIIQGHVASGSEQLFIREIRLQEHVTELDKLTQKYKKIPQSGPFGVQFNHYLKQDGHVYDRLLSKWVIVEQKSSDLSLRSHARYLDKIRSKWHYQQDTLRDRKRLGGFSASRDALISDLDSLDISSVTVNICANNWMRSKPFENTISFSFNGKTYYVDREQVEDMDQTRYHNDGESLTRLFLYVNNTKKEYKKNTFYWHYPLNVIKNPYDGYAMTPHSAIRKGDYKLIYDWYGRLKLYNIKKDFSGKEFGFQRAG